MMQKGNEIALDELVGQYPSYRWRIWTRRYCRELCSEVLSASSFFLDVPQEVLFFAPCIGEDKLDALLEELNARAGWDGAIEKWQARRLRALVAELPLPTPGSVGHG